MGLFRNSFLASSLSIPGEERVGTFSSSSFTGLGGLSSSGTFRIDRTESTLYRACSSLLNCCIVFKVESASRSAFGVKVNTRKSWLP